MFEDNHDHQKQGNNRKNEREPVACFSQTIYWLMIGLCIFHLKLSCTFMLSFQCGHFFFIISSVFIIGWKGLCFTCIWYLNVLYIVSGHLSGHYTLCQKLYIFVHTTQYVCFYSQLMLNLFQFVFSWLKYTQCETENSDNQQIKKKLIQAEKNIKQFYT